MEDEWRVDGWVDKWMGYKWKEGWMDECVNDG